MVSDLSNNLILHDSVPGESTCIVFEKNNDSWLIQQAHTTLMQYLKYKCDYTVYSCLSTKREFWIWICHFYVPVFN